MNLVIRFQRMFVVGCDEAAVSRIAQAYANISAAPALGISELPICQHDWIPRALAEFGGATRVVTFDPDLPPALHQNSVFTIVVTPPPEHTGSDELSNLNWALLMLDAERISRGTGRCAVIAASVADDPAAMFERFNEQLSLAGPQARAALPDTLFNAQHEDLTGIVWTVMKEWAAGTLPGDSDWAQLDSLHHEIARRVTRPHGQPHAASQPVTVRDIARLEQAIRELSGTSKSVLAEREADLLRKLERRDEEHLAAMIEAARREAKLKDLSRKYRETQQKLDATRKNLALANRSLARSEASVAERERELVKLRSQWSYRAAHPLRALSETLRKLKTSLPGERRRVRIAAERELVARSGLFDVEWYRERYADVALAGVDPLDHYLAVGWKENRDPGPLFSGSRYLRENADVARSGLNPLLHFIEYGGAEGRTTWRSKLVDSPDLVLPDFADPAPVYQPTCPVEALGQRSDQTPFAPAAVRLAFGDIEHACSASEQDARVLRRFKQLSLVDPVVERDWVEDEAHRSSLYNDAWFIDDLTVRIRSSGSAAQIAICQINPTSGQIEVLAQHGDLFAEAICDITLRSPLHPLLLVGFDDEISLISIALIAFPSLLPGGLHQAELLAEVALTPAEAPSAEQLGMRHARKLAQIRCGAAHPGVSSLALDIRDANGTGPLFAQPFRSWLSNTFGIGIAVANSPTNPGEQFLAHSAPLESSGRNKGAATLCLHADSLPSIGLLCAGCSSDHGDWVDHSLMSHAVLDRLDVDKGFFVQLPPVHHLASGNCDAARIAGTPRLNGAARGLSPIAIASISNGQPRATSDSDLLFPYSPNIQLTSFQPESVRLIVDARHSAGANLLGTLASLAIQDSKDRIALSFVGMPDGEALSLATRVFGKRVTVRRNISDALDDCSEVYCGIVHPGAILHDARSVAVLSAIVSVGAASASAPLIDSARKSDTGRINVVDNGLMASDSSSFAQKEIASSRVMWRETYPVRSPLAGLWLAPADSVVRWSTASKPAQFETLKADEGLHWCSAAISVGIDPQFLPEHILCSPPLSPSGGYTVAGLVPS